MSAATATAPKHKAAEKVQAPVLDFPKQETPPEPAKEPTLAERLEELAGLVQQGQAKIGKLLAEAVPHARDTGKILDEAYTLIKTNKELGIKWGKWCRETLGMTQQRANAYRAIAEEWERMERHADPFPQTIEQCLTWIKKNPGKEKSGHGGKRPGTGRKKTKPPTAVRVDPRTVTAASKQVKTGRPLSEVLNELLADLDLPFRLDTAKK